MCKESEKIIVLCYTEYGDNMTKKDVKWIRQNRDTIFFVLAGFVLFILLLVLYLTGFYRSIDSFYGIVCFNNSKSVFNDDFVIDF